MIPKAAHTRRCAARIGAGTILLAASAALSLAATFASLRFHAPRDKTELDHPQNATSPAASRGGKITGVVVADGGQPLPDAAVVGIRAGESNVQTEALGVRSVSTDDQGRFTLDGLSSGAYTLAAHAPGYCVEPGIIDDPHQNKYFRPGDHVVVRMIKGGVITGSVSNFYGTPVVTVRVRAVRIRDAEGRRANPVTPIGQPDWKTDDRGVYRIYGLQPGSYLVYAGGRGVIGFAEGPYENDSPTYYPSATRDTAAPVVLRGGDEITGIDIRYRDIGGHTVSGTIRGKSSAVSLTSATIATLTDVTSRAVESLTLLQINGGEGPFALESVADGDYHLTILAGDARDEKWSVASRRVKVNGTDVTGLDMTLSPLGSISGRVAIEQGAVRPGCPGKPAASFDGIVVTLQSDEPPNSDGTQGIEGLLNLSGMQHEPDALLNERGEFAVGKLTPGHYRIDAQLPGDELYVRQITAWPPGARRPTDVGRDGVSLRAGHQLSGVTITVAAGAARVRGKVVPAETRMALPKGLRVYLGPAEPERADDPLRYPEGRVESDGSFSITHIAPGKYKVLVKDVTDPSTEDSRRFVWDPMQRAMLRLEAEASTNAIELKPCQSVMGFVFRYRPALSPPGKARKN